MPDSVRQYLIPTGAGMGRGLVNHDDASRDFRAVDLTDQTKPRTKFWRRGAAYDQGQTAECVANTGKGILNTANLSRRVPYAVRTSYNRHDFYVGAQKNDQWWGENYEGTSALGLCRYLRSVGLISAYHWCFGLDDVLLTLSHVGPVGIGIKWKYDMFTPDKDGYVHPTGGDAGGHEVEVNGVDVVRRRVKFTNSWGLWGMRGMAYLSFDDLGTLLDDDGDAFVVTA